MTIADLLVLVRRDINDVAGTRWPDGTLLNYYNAFLRIAWARKPFIFYVSSILTSYPGDAATSSADINFDSIWSGSAIDYIDFRCLSEDSEDGNVLQLAQDHYNRFVASLT